jgi:hypothetical protein
MYFTVNLDSLPEVNSEAINPGGVNSEAIDPEAMPEIQPENNADVEDLGEKRRSVLLMDKDEMKVSTQNCCCPHPTRHHDEQHLYDVHYPSKVLFVCGVRKYMMAVCVYLLPGRFYCTCLTI